MPDVKLELDGLEKHLAQLEAVKNAAVAAMIEAALAGGQVVADYANQKLGKGEKVVARLNAAQTTARRVVIEIGLLKEFWYYRFQETGTSPHEISPETAEALRGFDSALAVFSEGHQVAGVPADPFLRPAVDNTQTERDQEMAAVYNRRMAEAVKGG